MEMCYSVSSCVDRVASRCVVDLRALFLMWCGGLVVDRAVEPVERVMCLNVAIASCLAMVVVPSISLLGLSSFFLLLFA